MRGTAPRVVLFAVQRHGRAKNDAVARVERLRIDYLQSRNLSLKLGNSSFDMALLLAGGIIFGILRKVTLFASFGDGGNDRRTGRLLKIFKLSLELFGSFGRNRNSIEHSLCDSNRQRPDETCSSGRMAKRFLRANWRRRNRGEAILTDQRHASE